MNTVSLPPSAAQMDRQPVPPRQPFALDYSNYIAKRYPKMSSQPMVVLLREQNTRAICHITMARQSIQCDMVNFMDKLMSALASSCTCCIARGLLDCPLRPEPPAVDEQSASGHSKRKGVTIGFTGSAEACYRTPKAPRLTGVRLDLSDCEGGSSSQRHAYGNGIWRTTPPVSHCSRMPLPDKGRAAQSCPQKLERQTCLSLIWCHFLRSSLQEIG